MIINHTHKAFYSLNIPNIYYIFNKSPVDFILELINKFNLKFHDFRERRFFFNSEEKAIEFGTLILNDYINRSDKITDRPESFYLSLNNESKTSLSDAEIELSDMLDDDNPQYLKMYRFSDDYKIYYDTRLCVLKMVRKTDIMLFTRRYIDQELVTEKDIFKRPVVKTNTSWHPHYDQVINLAISRWDVNLLA